MAWSVRSLAAFDGADVASVFGASRHAAMPWLPVVHTPDADAAFFTSELASSAGWGAVEAGRLIGFALTRDGWLNHLYIAPEWRGRGVGSTLLAHALDDSPRHLDLWVFARNAAALRFYARHGFEVVERTDGAGGDEGQPDVRMRSTGPEPVRLRTATPADADALARMHARSWQEAYAGIIDDDYLASIDVGERAQRWRTRLAAGQPGEVTQLATVLGSVVGFASSGPARDDDLARQQVCWAEVYALYVAPDRWRRGIGSALWRVLEEGWTDDVVAAAVWVLRDNARARAFYAARGLAPDGAERMVPVGARELAEVRFVAWR